MTARPSIEEFIDPESSEFKYKALLGQLLVYLAERELGQDQAASFIASLGQGTTGNGAERIAYGVSTVRAVLDQLLSGQTAGAVAKATKADLDADLARADGTLGFVTNDPTAANNGFYRKTGASGGGSWTKSAYDVLQSALTKVSELELAVLSVTGKNLLDKSKIRRGYYFSPGANAIVTSASYRCSGFIPVVPGTVYSVSGGDGGLIAWYASTSDANAISYITTGSGAAPAGANFAVVNVTSAGQDNLAKDDTVQFELGPATSYEPYKKLIPLDKIKASLLEYAKVLEVFSFNRINPAEINYTKRYSTGTKNFVTDAEGIAASGYIPVVEGETYTISGAGIYNIGVPTGCQGGYFSSAGALTAIDNIAFTAASGGGAKFTVPTGQNIKFVVISLKKLNGLAASTSLHGNAQMEGGTIANSYRAYSSSERVKPALIYTDPNAPVPLYSGDVMESFSYNMINPAACNFVKRYSKSSKAFVTDAEGIAASDYIPVVEGQSYALSGTNGIYGLQSGAAYCQGGYFSSYGALTAVDNISFADIEGGGASFQVPTGQGITHVVISLKKLNGLAASTSLNGEAQMERGKLVTAYRAYSASPKVKPTLIPETAQPSSGTAQVSIYNQPPTYSDVHKRLPLFTKHYHKRDTNITILLVGDSILARDYHTTYYSDELQAKRPPLLVSQNIASRLWDKVNWNNSEYSRYDRAGVFTENGAFVTVMASPGNTPSHGIDDAIWDDFNNRPGHTRMLAGAGGGSVQFTLADGTYVGNFIYRTDLAGSEINTVSVAQGNGKVQVFDEASASWVEANGYTFSMRHAAPTATRGTTKFQARLKLRTCDKHQGGIWDQRAGAKTIAITKSDTTDCRFMYWGLETSKEPYILKMINAARGSMNITSMLPYHEDDVADWINEPETFTLVVNEIYLNEGMNAYGQTRSFAEFLSRWNSYFYDTTNPLSFKSLSKVGADYWKTCEAVVFNPNPTAESGGFDLVEPYGWPTWMHSTDGMKTIYDNFMVYFWDYLENHSSETGLVFVNITQALVDEAKAKFGREFYKAFQASGIVGGSFYNDVTHPNNYGCAVMALWLYSVLHCKVA